MELLRAARQGGSHCPDPGRRTVCAVSNRELLAFVIVPIAVVALTVVAWLARHR